MILDSVRGGTKAVLAQVLETSHSEEEWDAIVDKVLAAVKLRIVHDLILADVLAEQDLFDSKGRVNVEGIIKAFQTLSAQDRPVGDKARLEHLTKYLASTCETLKLHRR